MLKNNHLFNLLKGLLVIIVVGALLMAVTNVALAVLYNISTTDSSVTEWESQGIQVFQTDPALQKNYL